MRLLSYKPLVLLLFLSILNIKHKVRPQWEPASLVSGLTENRHNIKHKVWPQWEPASLLSGLTENRHTYSDREREMQREKKRYWKEIEREKYRERDID